MFDVEKVTKGCIDWTRKWFEYKSGNAEGIVVLVSAGKDSAVTAKICAEAIGRDKVFGIIMPNGKQKDLDDAIFVCESIGIRYRIINIEKVYNSMMDVLNFSGVDNKYVISPHTATNISPRIRMTVAYAIAQEMHYRVAGSGNFSEKYVGYCTKHGDANGWDFNPIGGLLCTEVIKVGEYLGIPDRIIHKAPSDGLCGKSDEESFGFSYETLDEFIKNGKIEDKEVQKKIEEMRDKNQHKWIEMPFFDPESLYFM